MWPGDRGDSQMFKPYFEPKELTVLTAVLHRACLDMGVADSGQREIIAARIIRLAQTGKWDSNMPEKGPTISGFRHFFESLHTEASEKWLVQRIAPRAA